MIFGEHSAFDCRFSTAGGSSYNDTASQERARASAGIAGRMGPKQAAIFLADGRAIFMCCSPILGNFTILA
jgi:hypothetical protein